MCGQYRKVTTVFASFLLKDTNGLKAENCFLKLKLLDALWNELIVHNDEIRKEIRHRTSSRSVELNTYEGRLQDSGGPSTSVDVLTPTDDDDPAPKVIVTN